MLEAITLSLSADIKADLEAQSKIESISSNELIERAIRDYLVMRRFRSLRQKMLEKTSQQGGYKDEDIFEMVS
jgi:hypothetical protein